MPLALVLLGALLLPGPALAQSSSQSNCYGADIQSCSQNCAAARAQCIQNPSQATQPPRR